MIAKLFVLMIFAGVYVQAELPKYFPQCDVSSSRFPSCILKTTQILKPYIAKGIPELNIPSFNPFFLPLMTLQRQFGESRYTCKFHNFTIYDLVNYDFHKFEHNFTENEFSYRMFGKFERITVDATYDLDSKILLIPVKGVGKFDGILKNLEVIVEAHHDIYPKNGQRYLNLKSTNAKLKFSNDNILNFDQIIQDNPVLSEAVSRFFQDNNDLVLEEAGNPIGEVISQILAEVSKKIYDGNSVKDLFGTH